MPQHRCSSWKKTIPRFRWLNYLNSEFPKDAKTIIEFLVSDPIIKKERSCKFNCWLVLWADGWCFDTSFKRNDDFWDLMLVLGPMRDFYLRKSMATMGSNGIYNQQLVKTKINHQSHGFDGFTGSNGICNHFINSDPKKPGMIDGIISCEGSPKPKHHRKWSKQCIKISPQSRAQWPSDVSVSGGSLPTNRSRSLGNTPVFSLEIHHDFSSICPEITRDTTLSPVNV